MIRCLIEAHYFEHRRSAKPDAVRFWLHEMRTAGLLMEIAAAHPRAAELAAKRRPAVAAALRADATSVERALRTEEFEEREADRLHWKPLIEELGRLRRAR
jgi:hypothetical protein